MKRNIIKRMLVFFICIFFIAPTGQAISWEGTHDSQLLLAKGNKHKHKHKSKKKKKHRHKTQVQTHTQTQVQTHTQIQTKTKTQVVTHSYHYYPGSQVYFNPGKKMYFYRVGNDWKKSVKLPEGMVIKPGDQVNVKLDTDKPFLQFEQHKIKFPMNREFKFFPGAQVYFDPLAKTWFHLEGTSWKKSTKPPANISITETESVAVTLDTDEPYKHYEVHKVKYKHNKKHKKKHKKKH